MINKLFDGNRRLPPLKYVLSAKISPVKPTQNISR